jgi:hypothetical protein
VAKPAPELRGLQLLSSSSSPIPSSSSTSGLGGSGGTSGVQPPPTPPVAPPLLPAGTPSLCWLSRYLIRASGRSALPSANGCSPSSVPAAAAPSLAGGHGPSSASSAPTPSSCRGPVRWHVRGPSSGCNRRFCGKGPWAVPGLVVVGR